MSHTLFVCTSCGSDHRTKRAVSTSGSERLLEQLQALHPDSLPPDFSILAKILPLPQKPFVFEA